MQSEKLNKGNAGDLTQRPQAGRPGNGKSPGCGSRRGREAPPSPCCSEAALSRLAAAKRLIAPTFQVGVGARESSPAFIFLCEPA